MAEITAQKVNELRNKTGLGMMECKKALTEAGGDVDKAIENLRKKGVKTSIMERAATEGRVAASVSPDRKRAAAVEVVCNTDFTAKSDPVARFADLALQRLLSSGAGDSLAEDSQIKSELTLASQQTGENVQLRAELGSVKDRLQTLERIATEQPSRLARDIDALQIDTGGNA